MNDARKEPRGLPESRQRLLIVVEPGVDASALRQLGFNATINPMRGGKWQNSYTPALVAGFAKMVVIPNDDPASRARAKITARACLEAGLDVRVMLLPAKSVSAWLMDGATRDDLLVRMAAASPFHPDRPLTTLGLSGLWLRPLRGITPDTSLADIVAALDEVRAQTPSDADYATRQMMTAGAKAMLARTRATDELIAAVLTTPPKPPKERAAAAPDPDEVLRWLTRTQFVESDSVLPMLRTAAATKRRRRISRSRIELLADIQAICANRPADKISAAELVRALAAMPDRPWAERQITQAKLESLLKPLGVRPFDANIGSKTLTLTCYRRDVLADAWDSYLPPK